MSARGDVVVSVPRELVVYDPPVGVCKVVYHNSKEGVSNLLGFYSTIRSFNIDCAPCSLAGNVFSCNGVVVLCRFSPLEGVGVVEYTTC